MYIKLFKAKIAAMEGLRRLSEAQPKERGTKAAQMLNIYIQRQPKSVAYGYKAASFQPYATFFGLLCKLNNTKNINT